MKNQIKQLFTDMFAKQSKKVFEFHQVYEDMKKSNMKQSTDMKQSNRKQLNKRIEKLLEQINTSSNTVGDLSRKKRIWKKASL